MKPPQQQDEVKNEEVSSTQNLQQICLIIKDNHNLRDWNAFNDFVRHQNLHSLSERASRCEIDINQIYELPLKGEDGKTTESLFLSCNQYGLLSGLTMPTGDPTPLQTAFKQYNAVHFPYFLKRETKRGNRKNKNVESDLSQERTFLFKLIDCDYVGFSTNLSLDVDIDRILPVISPSDVMVQVSIRHFAMLYVPQTPESACVTEAIKVYDQKKRERANKEYGIANEQDTEHS